MSLRDHLDKRVIDIGLLIGLLTEASTSDPSPALSINKNWFSDPVSELLKCPTRLKGLLNVFSASFNPVEGTEYTLLDGGENWHSVYAGWDDSPTGLCLIAPKIGAATGALSVGFFSQTYVGELTVSMYGRIPLFRLQEGKPPQFILSNQQEHIDVTIDIYSEKEIRIGSDEKFNMASLAAKAQLDGSFSTSFSLKFYQGFDPKKKSKTELPAAGIDATIARIGNLITQAGYWLNGYIGSAPVTVGELLSACGLVDRTEDATSGRASYSFDKGTLDRLGKNPTDVFTRFLISTLTRLLDEAAASETSLVDIYDGGIYAVKDKATNRYGLRFAVPDFIITPPTGTGPQITINLGKWFTDETDNDNWIEQTSGRKTQPGVNVYFLKYEGGSLSTTAAFNCSSIGLDFTGRGDAPLINLNGYVLQKAELRAYLDSTNWAYGFGIRLNSLGIPLGPNFSATQNGNSQKNVVAQNLLASADRKDDSVKKDSDATNPVFSAEAAYIKGHSPIFRLFDDAGHKADLVWFPIQRRFGPLNCKKVGVKVEASQTSDPTLGVVFDGGVSLGPLDLQLDQLSVNAHLKRAWDVTDYELDLKGLSVSFSTESVQLSGGLVKNTDGSATTYDGEALLRFQDMTIAALGSYGSLQGGGTSLFIFAMLNRPIGGPAFFYVTGLSAGFGYNRGLKIPALADVRKFPLLAGLTDSSQIGGSDPKPKTALAALRDGGWVPPERGSYWLAAGVQFSTFEVIKTNALLVITFGNEFAITVIGHSTLKQPQSGRTYVYAEMDFLAVFRPSEGELKASAVLGPGSYVLTPDAKLTGGFAFYSWFGDNPHSGDFVYTVGGYHPAFNVPAHYPKVPRLGINWQVSDHLSMIGEAYYAITPTAMMAGCALQITFEDGPLKAWLKAKADLILFWKPFYLMADASISVGVSFHINVWFVDTTLSVEIGAEFHLWGPPIGGSVYVDWSIISFTIRFGSDRQPPPELNWNQFKEMLPTKPPQRPAPRELRATSPPDEEALASNPAPSPQAAYLYVNANDGLLRVHTEPNLSLWLVRPGSFQFTTGSAVPASQIQVNDYTVPNVEQGIGIPRLNGGISPDAYRSLQTVTISLLEDRHIQAARAGAILAGADSAAGSNAGTPVEMKGWTVVGSNKHLPKAMWSNAATSINADSSTIKATVGVTVRPAARKISNCTPQMVIRDVFADRTINPENANRLSVSQSDQPINNPAQKADSFPSIAAINGVQIAASRKSVFAALERMGINAWTNNPMTATAASPGRAFADEPMEGSPVPSGRNPIAPRRTTKRDNL
jgi:hypothetical protein